MKSCVHDICCNTSRKLVMIEMIACKEGRRARTDETLASMGLDRTTCWYEWYTSSGSIAVFVGCRERGHGLQTGSSSSLAPPCQSDPSNPTLFFVAAGEFVSIEPDRLYCISGQGLVPC